MKVLLLLTPLFVLVGFWLYFYSNRRSRLIQEVSAKLGLAYHAKDDGSLEQCLNQAFQLEAPLGRDFSQIRDVADAEGIKLFRVTEALDLSPHGLPQNSHFGRIAVFCPIPSHANFYFLTRGGQELRAIVPQTAQQISSEPAFQAIYQVLCTFPPSHLLSITLMRGCFLAYFEPLLTGSEKIPELLYLLQLAQRVRRAL